MAIIVDIRKPRRVVLKNSNVKLRRQNLPGPRLDHDRARLDVIAQHGVRIAFGRLRIPGLAMSVPPSLSRQTDGWFASHGCRLFAITRALCCIKVM